jgi:hypothetical protein
MKLKSIVILETLYMIASIIYIISLIVKNIKKSSRIKSLTTQLTQVKLENQTISKDYQSILQNVVVKPYNRIAIIREFSRPAIDELKKRFPKKEFNYSIGGLILFVIIITIFVTWASPLYLPNWFISSWVVALIIILSIIAIIIVSWWLREKVSIQPSCKSSRGALKSSL